MNPISAVPDPIDALLNDVLHDLANPAPAADFANRLTHRSLTMNLELATPEAANVLQFTALDSIGGRGLSARSTTIAVLFNLAALLLLGVQVRTAHILSQRQEAISLVDPMVPPPAPPKLNTMGGGGGQAGPTPVAHGNPPKFATEQLNPPKAPVESKLNVPVTVDVDPNLKMAKADVPNLGMPNSPLVGTSLGNGRGNGIGAGNGNGLGPGNGGNMGGGLRRIGGGVSAPVVLFAPEPQFSEEARKAKVSGNVLVYLQVDTEGRPTHLRVLRGIGLGLDEKALEAVAHYKFKPATENGHPVPVEMNVEVNFNIY